MLAKHGAAERRVVRNARLHGVGLLRADDSIRRLFLQIKVADLHGAAKADDTGALDVTYFNQPYRKNSLHAGEEYIFYGKVEANGFRKTLTNPSVSRRRAAAA